MCLLYMQMLHFTLALLHVMACGTVQIITALELFQKSLAVWWMHWWMQ